MPFLDESQRKVSYVVFSVQYHSDQNMRNKNKENGLLSRCPSGTACTRWRTWHQPIRRLRASLFTSRLGAHSLPHRLSFLPDFPALSLGSISQLRPCLFSTCPDRLCPVDSTAWALSSRIIQIIRSAENFVFWIYPAWFVCEQSISYILWTVYHF